MGATGGNSEAVAKAQAETELGAADLMGNIAYTAAGVVEVYAGGVIAIPFL